MVVPTLELWGGGVVTMSDLDFKFLDKCKVYPPHTYKQKRNGRGKFRTSVGSVRGKF